MKLRRQKWRTLYRMWLGGTIHPVKIAVNAQPTNITESFMGWGAKFGPEGSSIIGSPSGNPE